jgi:eukaryotic-like serine/threonine-protein kinase
MPPAVPSASLAPVPDDLFVRLQTALAGEYSLERELGRGGMGVVYLAREVRLAREVAIKLLPPALADQPGMREQFLREAQMAARLSHPNIVPIHRVDEARGLVYFVMAYVPGETLAQRVREHGPLGVPQTAQVLRDVAWALTYAHASGIIHRDVKAENILLERGTGRALMTDFGIASAAHAASARDADGAVAGSAHYASPEQIAGEPPDAASDLYSLGVVGFLALVGRLPFDAPTTREVIAMHLNARPPSITALAPTVPPRFAQLVERCLAKRPEHRFHSASEFAEALDLAVEKPREIPAPIRVWLTRIGQRRRVAVAASLYVSVVGSFPLSLSLHLGVGGIFVFGGLLLTTFSLSVWLPWLVSTRKVLRAGYDLNDLRVAVRDNWIRRHEELVYEQASGFRIPFRVLLPCFGAAAVSTVAFIAASRSNPASWMIVGTVVSGAAAAVSGVLGLGFFIRNRLIAGLGRRQVKFYNGRWAERFVRLAGLGLKKRTADHALPQLTEVALGRATDALYDALPKSLKKELKQLPAAVRRLEDDARMLRAELDKLDASIASLDSDAGAALSATLAASPRDAEVHAERERLQRELRLTRERAGDRLAATVAALENIRLDLLRLQLGDGRVESVTASLYAARQVADDVGAYVDATKEVEASLASPRP